MFLFLRFKVKNMNFVPVEIERISAVDELKIVILKIFENAIDERPKIGSMIIKKKNGLQFVLEDRVIKMMTCGNVQAYDIKIIQSIGEDDSLKDMEFLEVL